MSNFMHSYCLALTSENIETQTLVIEDDIDIKFTENTGTIFNLPVEIVYIHISQRAKR